MYTYVYKIKSGNHVNAFLVFMEHYSILNSYITKLIWVYLIQNCQSEQESDDNFFISLFLSFYMLNTLVYIKKCRSELCFAWMHG